MDQHREARAGEDVGVGPSAVIFLVVRVEERRRYFASLGDLLLAIEFEATVIVQRDDARERAGRPRRLEQPRLGARAVADRPGDRLARHAIALPPLLDAYLLRLLVRAGEAQHVADLLARILARHGDRVERLARLRRRDPIAEYAEVLIRCAHGCSFLC